MKIPAYKNNLKRKYAEEYFKLKEGGASEPTLLSLWRKYGEMGLSVMARQAVAIRYMNLVRQRNYFSSKEANRQKGVQQANTKRTRAFLMDAFLWCVYDRILDCRGFFNRVARKKPLTNYRNCGRLELQDKRRLYE